MKTASLMSLTAALFLSATPIVFAQTTATAGVDLSLDANADGTVDAQEAAAGVSAEVDAEVDVDLTLDTNGDGTVDEGEAAAGANEGANLDTDGDGIVSEAEAAAGANSSNSEVCSSVDLDAMSSATASDVAAATNAQVLSLTDCEDGVVGSLSPDVLAALTANTVIAGVLEQETVAAGEILGLSVEAQTVIVYVRAEDEAGTSATTDTTATPTAQ